MIIKKYKKNNKTKQNTTSELYQIGNYSNKFVINFLDKNYTATFDYEAYYKISFHFMYYKMLDFKKKFQKLSNKKVYYNENLSLLTISKFSHKYKI